MSMFEVDLYVLIKTRSYEWNFIFLDLDVLSKTQCLEWNWMIWVNLGVLSGIRYFYRIQCLERISMFEGTFRIDWIPYQLEARCFEWISTFGVKPMFWLKRGVLNWILYFWNPMFCVESVFSSTRLFEWNSF